MVPYFFDEFEKIFQKASEFLVLNRSIAVLEVVHIRIVNVVLAFNSILTLSYRAKTRSMSSLVSFVVPWNKDRRLMTHA